MAIYNKRNWRRYSGYRYAITLDTRRDKNLLGTFISDIVLQLLSFLAEKERVNIRQRQVEGIRVRFGHPIKDIPHNFDNTVCKLVRKEITVQEIMKMYNISESTFYRRLREYRTVKLIVNNKSVKKYTF